MIMKKVEAIVRSSKFEDVKEGLEAAGIHFFTYLEVKGHGMEKGDEFKYRGVPYDAGFIPRHKLEIVVPDTNLEKVLDTILENAKTGHIGDGKIIITPIESFIRIRTGERAEAAL